MTVKPAHYHVYGLGNAVVDIEYQVTPEQLTALAIDKGVMTLVDVERQRRIMRQLAELPVKRSCGGSAANSLIAVSQFGGKAFFACKVAADEIGSFYLQDLLTHGVATNPQADPPADRHTGTCLVFITPDADRSMNTHLGVAADLAPTDLDAAAIAAAEFVYIEGYLVTSQSAHSAAIRARETARAAGVAVAMSLSDPNMVDFFKPGLLEIMGEGVDLLFANEAEAMKMAATDRLDEALQHLQSLAKTFAMTRGARGALVCDGRQVHEIAPHKVKAVDTVGAGDMFAGAFLYGITHGMDYRQAGDLASAASARLVTEYGPRMSTAEAQAILRQVNEASLA